MVGVIETQEEVNTLIILLRKEEFTIKCGRDKKYRLKKKSEKFILFNNELYLKQDDGLHKKVIAQKKKN